MKDVDNEERAISRPTLGSFLPWTLGDVCLVKTENVKMLSLYVLYIVGRANSNSFSQLPIWVFD